MGSNEISFLYKDKEQNSENKDLKNFIEQNKASMFLIEFGIVQDYLDNQSKILEYENKKGKTEEASRIYSEYESNIAITKFHLERAETLLDDNNIEDKINKFNDIFGKYSKLPHLIWLIINLLRKIQL